MACDAPARLPPPTDKPVAFIIARKSDCIDGMRLRGGFWVWELWTGEVDGEGEPIGTRRQFEAFYFTNYGAALQCAVTHRGLYDEDGGWRVMRADRIVRGIHYGS